MATAGYIYLRALELEGHHPQDVGAWTTTVRRIEAGEGAPSPFDPAARIELPKSGPLPPSPTLDRSRHLRSTYYKRIRSTDEVKRYLERVGPLQVALELFPSWANPPGGIITMPDPGENPLEMTHAVLLSQFDDNGRFFSFRNSWGETWGDRGHGYLPYEYFDRYVFECWGTYFVGHFLREQYKSVDSRLSLYEWTARDEWDDRVYGFKFLEQDRGKGEPRAWCFVVDRGDAVDIEEFYVRPELRGQKLGARLADQVAGFIKGRKKPVRLWVPFADCMSEAPENYDRLVAITRRLDLVFRPSPVRWAAYFATSDRGGETSPFPIEPDRVPHRPKGTREYVMAAALVLNPAPPPTIEVTVAAPTAVREDFPQLGTENWDRMNRRRNFLIRKKVINGPEGLTLAEFEEYEWLQQMSLQTVRRTLPNPTEHHDELVRLRAILGRESGDPTG